MENTGKGTTPPPVVTPAPNPKPTPTSSLTTIEPKEDLKDKPKELKDKTDKATDKVKDQPKDRKDTSDKLKKDSWWRYMVNRVRMLFAAF